MPFEPFVYERGLATLWPDRDVILLPPYVVRAIGPERRYTMWYDRDSRTIRIELSKTGRRRITMTSQGQGRLKTGGFFPFFWLATLPKMRLRPVVDGNTIDLVLPAL